MHPGRVRRPAFDILQSELNELNRLEKTRSDPLEIQVFDPDARVVKFFFAYVNDQTRMI